MVVREGHRVRMRERYRKKHGISAVVKCKNPVCDSCGRRIYTSATKGCKGDACMVAREEHRVYMRERYREEHGISAVAKFKNPVCDSCGRRIQKYGPTAGCKGNACEEQRKNMRDYVRNRRAKKAEMRRHDGCYAPLMLAKRPLCPVCNRYISRRVPTGDCEGDVCRRARAENAAAVRRKMEAKARPPRPICEECGKPRAHYRSTRGCRGDVCQAERDANREYQRRRAVTPPSDRYPRCPACALRIRKLRPTLGCNGKVCKAERAAVAAAYRRNRGRPPSGATPNLL